MVERKLSMLKSDLLLRRQRPLTLSLWSPTQYTVVHLVARSERALSVSVACGVLNPGETPQRTLAITEHDRVPGRPKRYLGTFKISVHFKSSPIHDSFVMRQVGVVSRGGGGGMP